LLDELNKSLKISVTKAIEIGKELHEIKKELGHGNFLAWIKNNLELSERTAQNYMRLYNYRDKTAIVADLQTAYKQVDQIEYQKKKTQEEEDRKIIEEYKHTGIKPEGWKRRHDYLYKTYFEEEAFKERVKSYVDEKAKASERKKKKEKQMSDDVEQAREKLKFFQQLKDQDDEDEANKRKIKIIHQK